MSMCKVCGTWPTLVGAGHACEQGPHIGMAAFFAGMARSYDGQRYAQN